MRSPEATAGDDAKDADALVDIVNDDERGRKEGEVAKERDGVMSREEGPRFQARAREVQAKCREAGGRRRAADIVLGLIKESE